jgi:hypothetical protein
VWATGAVPSQLAVLRRRPWLTQGIPGAGGLVHGRELLRGAPAEAQGRIAVPLHTLEQWSAAVRESLGRLELNISPPNVLEALFLRMREIRGGEGARSAEGAP